MNTPKRFLRRKDVEFAIRIDGELMGRLYISKGGIDCRPAHGKKPNTMTSGASHKLFTGEKWVPTGTVEEFDDSDVD
jgi:hypothetical protein